MDVPTPAYSLVTGTLTKYVLLAVNIVLGIILMPFTIRHLGTAEYGLWMLVASVTYYFQLLDLGYGTGVVRHVAEADARHDTALANQILSTFTVVYAGIGVVAGLVIGATILWAIPRFPNLRPEQVARGQILLALMGLRIAIGFPMTVFGAATTARQRFALNNSVAIAAALVNGAVTYLVLAAGYGLLTLVSATTAIALCSYGAYAWTARRAFPELRIRLGLFSRKLVRDVTTFSVYLFIIDIALQVGFNLDNVIIAAVLGTSPVAVYAIALRLADMQRQLCNQFNGLLFPIVVRFDASGRNDALRSMLIDGTRIALTLVVGVTVCVVGFASPLIARWMGPGFEGSIAALYALALAGVVLVGQGPLGNVLLGTGRHRLVAFSALGEASANLILSLLLVRRFGILGVAMGTAISVVAAHVVVLIPACRLAGVTIAEFAALVGRAPLVGAVPAAAAAVLFRQSLPPSSLTAIVAEGTAVGLIYVASVCAFGLNADVRSRYVAYVRRFAASTSLIRRMKPAAV